METEDGRYVLVMWHALTRLTAICGEAGKENEAIDVLEKLDRVFQSDYSKEFVADLVTKPMAVRRSRPLETVNENG